MCHQITASYRVMTPRIESQMILYNYSFSFLNYHLEMIQQLRLSYQLATFLLKEYFHTLNDFVPQCVQVKRKRQS